MGFELNTKKHNSHLGLGLFKSQPSVEKHTIVITLGFLTITPIGFKAAWEFQVAQQFTIPKEQLTILFQP